MLSSPNTCQNAMPKSFVFYFQEVQDFSSKSSFQLKSSLCCVFWFAVAFAHTTDKVVLCLHLCFLQFALIQTESEHKSTVHTAISKSTRQIQEQSYGTHDGSVQCSLFPLYCPLFPPHLV